MSLVLIVYLIGVLPGLSGGFGFIACMGIFFSLGAGGLLLLASLDQSSYSWEEKEYVIKKSLTKKLWGIRSLKLSLVFILLGFIASIIPSEKTMYTMVAVYGAEKIAETPAAQQLGNDAFDVLKGLVAKAKKELSDDASKDAVKEKK